MMRAHLIAAMLALAPAAAAQTPMPDAPAVSPETEARARAVGQQLRCVVCQNQSIEESDAQLAADMRRLVREQLEAGVTEAEVIEGMRARYGDFVLLSPPVQANTLILWVGPFALIGGALLAYLLMGRRGRRQDAVAAPLSDAERARLTALRERAE